MKKGLAHKIRLWKRGLSAEESVKAVLIICILFAFAVFLLFPLIMLFAKAFENNDGSFAGFAQFSKYLSSKNMLISLGNTIYISVFSTVIAVTLAFIFAYSLTRKHIPCKKLFRFGAMLPMFAPTMLLGIALIYIMGKKGILTAMGLKLPLYGKLGIIIAESIYCFPVALMILSVAFSNADNRLYEAAEVMDTKAWRKMLTITLPSVKYGLINAIFVCFTYSFTDFGAPSVVGGNVSVLSTDVYKQVIGQQNFNMGAVVGIFMMIPTVISFIVDRITGKKQDQAVSSKAVPYVIKKHTPTDIICTGYCALVTLSLVAFFAVAFYGSVVTFWPYNKTLTWKHYDFSTTAAGSGNQAIYQSVLVAIFTAVVGTAIAFITAYSVEKLKKFPRLRKCIYFFSIAPNAVPGTVIGLSYILFFNPLVFPIGNTGYGIENSLNFLYGTTAILVIVNIIHYFSVPFVTASTALKKLDREYETVSESLKVPFYRTFFRITVPMSINAILEMLTYYFTNAMITVSAVVFLYTPLTKVASIVVLNADGAGNEAEACAICMVIMVINLAVRFIYEIINKLVIKRTSRWLVR